MPDASNPMPPISTFVKLLPDVSKIEVFTGQNFCCWQEHVHILLDVHVVVFAFSTPKPDVVDDASQLQQWVQANKVCCHTLLSALSNDLFDVYCSYKESKEIWDSLILKYIVEDVVRQRFIIANYYHWTMTLRYKSMNTTSCRNTQRLKTSLCLTSLFLNSILKSCWNPG